MAKQKMVQWATELDEEDSENMLALAKKEDRKKAGMLRVAVKEFLQHRREAEAAK